MGCVLPLDRPPAALTPDAACLTPPTPPTLTPAIHAPAHPCMPVVRAMEILTKHCLGDRPVSLQILSDQAQNFATG